MKYYLLFIILLIFSSGFSQSADDFIVTYEVDYSTGLSVQFPIFGSDYTVDTGDGTILPKEEISHTGVHHIYDAPGTYTVVVSGDFNRVDFSIASASMEEILKTIEQWGTTQWITMENAFFGMHRLTVNATNVPDLSLVTNMSNMFRECYLFNSPINDWDVSNVTDMSYLFQEAFAFNYPLDNWDVSNVTDMTNMFARASSFNQNINNWNVSNVTIIDGMFQCHPEDNSSFNQPLNNWNVSNVTNMGAMFSYASEFNQPLDNWEVSNVVEFRFMFSNATSFNQNINNWDTSNAINMEYMFNEAGSFNQPLNNWDLTNNSTIRKMFYNAVSFNQPLNNWNTSNVIFMTGAFHNASSFNQDISDWNFENVFDFGTTDKSFIGYTAMDTNNYDALLLSLVHSGIQDKIIRAYGIEYCDIAVRSYLVNELNWKIFGDNLSDNCIDYSVSGTVFFDFDNNDCDANDIPTNEFLINATSNDFDYGAIILDGNYAIEAIQGTRV